MADMEEMSRSDLAERAALAGADFVIDGGLIKTL
jgi:hypothetical protein